MKNLNLIAFTLVASLFAVTNVFAEEVDTEAELLECITVNGNTCTLTQNIESDSRLIVDTGKEIILDLNGKTLDLNFKDDAYWTVFAKGNLTIQGNGTMNIANINGIAVTGSLTIKNGTFNQPVGDTIVGNYGGELIVENGTFIGDYYGINGIGGTTIIKDGNFKTNPFKPWGVEDDYEYYWAIAYDSSNGAKLEVQKGTFNQILSWPNVLADGAEVNYILEGQNVIYDIVEVTGKMNIELNGNKVMFDDASLYDGLGNLFSVVEGGELTIKDSKGTGIITTNNYNEIENVVKVNNGKLNISGGNFEAATNVFSVTGDKAVTNITGGTFTNDVKEYVTSGYATKKVGDNYTVEKVYKVDLTTPTNGELVSTAASSFAGETITVTATPKEGYKLDKITVVDKDGKEVRVTDNKFVMPNSDVTISVSFVKTTTSVELPKVDTEEEPEEVIVGISGESETEQTLLESLKEYEEILDKVKNENVTVGVEISTINEEELDEEVIEEIKKVADKLTVTDFFDISVVVRNEEETVDTIGELTKEIELMILLPETLKNVGEGLERKFYVIREHEGKIEKIDAKLSEDGKYLTFKSDKFSTYALAYEDVEEVKVNEGEIDTDGKVELPPQTGDNVITYLLIGLMSLVAFAGTGMFLKKNYNK